MWTRRFFILTLSTMLWVVGCQPQGQSPADPNGAPLGSAVVLNGTGADFPFFVYQRWFQTYTQQNPAVQINYQPTGSEVGIQQIRSGTIDFAGSDIAMGDDDIAQVETGVVMIPMTAGSVAIAYNLPGIDQPLNLPRAVYPEIFLGRITQWNDPQIAAANPEINLPDLPIILVHRSDGSGTTATVTAHLSAISPEWEQQVGSGLTVPWPAGVGVKSNAGVSAQIQQAAGALGYVEYSYAQQLGMAIAALENQAGNYILPSVASADRALSEVSFPENLRAFVPDPADPEAYPMATYSWLLLYQRYEDPAKASALQDFVQWALTEGQSYSEALGYVPLSSEVAQKGLAAVEAVGS
jgi:phosphate transport system substrate-binding protein